MDQNTVIVGFTSSVLTEILKLVPWLNQNALSKALTALAVCLVGAFIFTAHAPGDYAAVITVALVSYQAVIQPLATVSGIKTQV